MILLTGGGAFAEAFQSQFECRIVSARRMTDVEFSNSLKGVTSVIHNSANIFCESSETCVADNLDLTKRLINLVFELNPECQFIHLGSMSYLATDQTFKTEEKMSPYAFSKYLSEKLVLDHELKNSCSVRFSTLFYKNPKRDGLSNLIHQAATTSSVKLYAEGVARRNFLPIEIAAKYIEKVCDQKHSSKPTYNIVGNGSTSFAEALDFIEQSGESIEKINLGDLSSDVLCDFSPEDCEHVGKINFELKDEVLSYFQQIRNQNQD